MVASGTERTTLEVSAGLDTGELGSGDSVGAKWYCGGSMRGESIPNRYKTNKK